MSRAVARPVVMAALLMAACGKSGGGDGSGSGAPIGSAGAAAVAGVPDDAGGPLHARWRCTAPDAELAPLGSDALAGVDGWQVAAHGIARTGEHAELVVGVVADTGGAAPKTLAALGELRAQLDAAHVDLVVTLGGMAAAQPELEAVLGVLAAPRVGHAAVPLVALPGDLEPVGALTAALAALRGRGALALDGRLVRWIDAPGVAFATVPGAALPVDADGCAWTAPEVAAIYAALAAKPGLRVALVAEPPREPAAGETTAGTAAAAISGNLAGDPALAPTVAIDAVVHGPATATPTPERTGGRDGTRALLSPGTADATPRLPAGHAPSAGVLTVRGAAWTWRPLVAH